MMSTDRLERELESWFVDAAAPSRPDYTDDLIRDLATAPQWPRWAFPARWFPADGWPDARLPRLRLGLLVVAGLLALLAVAAVVGSDRPLPPPFGPAANGLVAYTKSGDIFAVDPETGTRRAISIGPDDDHTPRWSLDGTRLAFLRGSGSGDLVMFVDADGAAVAATETPLFRIDHDSIAWSPDGRYLALGAATSMGAGLMLVDATDGSISPLPIDYRNMEAFWRPPHGREIAFVGGATGEPGIYRYSLDDGSVAPIPMPTEANGWRPAGWTPDGGRFVVHADELDNRLATYLIDVATGDFAVIDLPFGRLSNDGSRLVGFALDDVPLSMCVMSVDGGPCERIGEPGQSSEPTHWAGLQWSPDDRWLLLQSLRGDPATVVDADGGTTAQPDWLADGGEAWQRIAH